MNAAGSRPDLAARPYAISNCHTAIGFLTSALNSTAAALIASSAVVAMTWPNQRARAVAR
jgi:hypothetical protein